MWLIQLTCMSILSYPYHNELMTCARGFSAGLPVNNTGTHQGNEVSNAQTNDGTITTVGTLDIRTFLPFSARVAYIGCIVIRRKDGNGGPPFPAVVNPTRNRGNCARFNITSDQKSHIFRFQEV